VQQICEELLIISRKTRAVKVKAGVAAWAEEYARLHDCSLGDYVTLAVLEAIRREILKIEPPQGYHQFQPNEG